MTAEELTALGLTALIAKLYLDDGSGRRPMRVWFVDREIRFNDYTGRVFVSFHHKRNNPVAVQLSNLSIRQ